MRLPVSDISDLKMQWNRRVFLRRSAAGLGMAALGSLLAENRLRRRWFASADSAFRAQGKAGDLPLSIRRAIAT